MRKIEDGDVVLGCMPWSLEWFLNYPGAKAGNCAYCDASIVISVPGQQLLTEEPDIQIACPSCLAKAPQADQLAPQYTPEMRKEIKAVMGKEPEEILSGSVKEAAEKVVRDQERKQNS